MYKIYFGERYLLITDKGINISANVFPIESINNLFDFVTDFDVLSTEKCVILLSQNPSIVFAQIIDTFLYIEAAGGLVINEDNELLMIYRYNKWDLPKGKREKGEMINQTALREVEEECGILGHTIVKELPSTFHTYHDKKQLCIKQTFWFEMKYKRSKNCTPQIEEDITEVIWVNKNDFPRLFVNTYTSVIDSINCVF